MQKLTIDFLKQEAQEFSQVESRHKEKSLFGITDGKAVGTYLEHKFKNHLQDKYHFEIGSSASGIDFPGLQVDMKVINVTELILGYPFREARQKIYGLEYSLLIFVYEKSVNKKLKTVELNIPYLLFLDPDKTGDFQTTICIKDILRNGGNKDDLTALMFDSHLLFDEIKAGNLADEILSNPPQMGFLMTSNNLRWRLKYFGMLEQAHQGYENILLYKA